MQMKLPCKSIEIHDQCSNFIHKWSSMMKIVNITIRSTKKQQKWTTVRIFVFLVFLDINIMKIDIRPQNLVNLSGNNEVNMQHSLERNVEQGIACFVIGNVIGYRVTTAIFLFRRFYFLYCIAFFN